MRVTIERVGPGNERRRRIDEGEERREEYERDTGKGRGLVMPVMLLLLLPVPLMPAPMSRNEEFPFSPLLFPFYRGFAISIRVYDSLISSRNFDEIMIRRSGFR